MAVEGQLLHRHIDPTKKRFQGAYPPEQFPGGWPRAPAVSLNLFYIATSHCFVRIPVLRLGGPSAQILLDHSVNIIMTTGCHDDCDCRLSILLVKLYSHRDYDYILSSAMKVAKVPAKTICK